jgi:molybdopterin-binding protein
MYDAGHAISHRLGGGADINLTAQLASVNRRPFQSALAPLVDSTSTGSTSARSTSDRSSLGRPRVESRERFRTVSGRNQLVGKIVEVKFSGLLAKVVLAVGDQQITSIITADAAREMQLRKGQTAAALMKSTEVMIERV